MENIHPNSKWIEPVSEFLLTRQNLPHIQSPGESYFTTTNTWQRVILDEEERSMLMSAMRFHDGSKYTLDAAVVMPDHFHAIFRPMQKGDGDVSLPEIFHSIESYSAKQIIARRKKITGRKMAHVFQKENFDHLIRNEKDYQEKLWYLIQNPVEAGLVQRCEDYPWLYCPVIGKH